jgi:hypothetical protein
MGMLLDFVNYIPYGTVGLPMTKPTDICNYGLVNMSNRLLSEVPRTKTLVVAHLPWLCAVFRTKPSVFLCLNFYYEAYSLDKSGT